jgi:hypothetical protein
MPVKTWIVIDYGDVSPDAETVPYECPCGVEAELPIKGRPIAAIGGGGIVFDTNERGALPKTIQCRKCRRILTQEEELADVR